MMYLMFDCFHFLCSCCVVLRSSLNIFTSQGVHMFIYESIVFNACLCVFVFCTYMNRV